MNLTDYRDITALLQRHGFRFSKSMGQNFLTAAWVPADIADASGADEHTGVLEVGPGIGCLTEQLAQRAGKVVFPLHAQQRKGLVSVVAKIYAVSKTPETANDRLTQCALIFNH